MSVSVRSASSDKFVDGDRVIPMDAKVHSLLSDLAKEATSPLFFPSNRNPGEKLLHVKNGFK